MCSCGKNAANPVLAEDLKLGQYTKLPPRATLAAQMIGSIVGSIFNYTSEYLRQRLRPLLNVC